MEKKKILIVEDEPEMVQRLKRRLEANGYETIEAYDGEAGLELAKSKNPDLILLDLMLPKLDGYKLCGLLKADSRYSKVPVLIFTALAQESDEQMAKEAGADAYITKPFKAEVLLAKIKELLREA